MNIGMAIIRQKRNGKKKKREKKSREREEYQILTLSTGLTKSDFQ